MIGEVVGNFRVIRQLGKGGMGEVWLAEHKDIQTRVAVKMLLPHISADKQHVQRFFNEAVAVSKIKHAGIAKIFDVGFHTRGDAYLIMEFLEGEPLGNRIKRLGRLPLREVADLGRQIASVLEATHAVGITHRDLKPDNIFLVPDSELDSGERVKVLDFGIAKLAGAGALTGTSGSMGTPAYMSPEQWKSSARVDGRADIYSLGCLAFEMACGRPPFVCESIGEACEQHLNAPPPSSRQIASDVPAELEALIARLLAKSPDDRPNVRDTKLAFGAFTNLSSDSRVDMVAPTMMGEDVSQHVAAATSSSRRHTPSPALSPSRVDVTTLGASASSLVVPPAPAPAAKSGRGALYAALALVVLGGGGALAYSKLGSGGGPTPPAPQPQATAPAPSPASGGTTVQTHVQVRAVPDTAEIRIDDVVVANPYDGHFLRDGVQHRIKVRAAGFVAENDVLAVDQDQNLTITLDKDPTATVATPAGSAASKPPVIVTTTGPKKTVTATPPVKPAIGVTTAVPPVATPIVTLTTPPVVPATVVTTPPPGAGSGSGKTIYKGTKGTIIVDFPDPPK